MKYGNLIIDTVFVRSRNMERHSLDKTPCLVANGNHPMALALIRSLGRRGVPVFVLSGINSSSNLYHRIIKASRYIYRRIDFDERDYETNLMQALIETGRGLGERIALLPASDRDMEIISRNRQSLLPFYAFRMPPHKTIESILNKREFYTYAIQNNLPIPKTLFPTTPADLPDMANKVRYPCIIKPNWRNDVWIARFGNQKVIKCDSPDSLYRQFSDIVALLPHCVVQELIPGPEQNIYCSFAILDDKSDALCMFVCRKLRQYPPYFGNTSMAESVEEERVVRLTKEICRKMSLVGYVSIEFKYDARDDTFRVIEITPARLNRQGMITEAAGLPFIKIWYESCMRGTIAPYTNYRTHIKWISEINEARCFPFYIKHSIWSALNWIKTYRHTRGFELFAWDDLLPFFSFVPAMCVGFLAAQFRRLGKVSNLLSAQRKAVPIGDPFGWQYES